ncbi:ankyrin repeats (3 copies) domain-containing protein [Ditylenchus destructor]|uniref:Ankyrin repeats (3 copies) domain-containing protein n=1 Tax=Ditylenchus destructor TaxID=166010 RepID=A0AAD4N2Y4_9BILA|nr:ankyrin repeats (3 copies) domain-containing protein [Ditylenchus destructor]
MNDRKYDRALSLAKVILAAKEELPDLIDALNERKYDRALSFAKEGVGIKAKDKNDATPLHLALKDYYIKWNKREELVKALLESGADANAIAGDHYNGATPLLYAAEHGTDNMAVELLKHGAKVDGKDSYDWTPLLQAARCGRTEMAKMFMEKGADVMSRTKSGDGVLNWAAISGKNELVEIFLANGADPSLIGSGSTPLMNAARNNHEKVVKTLLKDKRVRDTINVSNAYNGYSALDYAQKNHYTNIVKTRLFSSAFGAGKKPRSVHSGRLGTSSLRAPPSVCPRLLFGSKSCSGVEQHETISGLRPSSS